MTEDFYHVLSQPLTTEEGYLNEACINELSAAIQNMPLTHERLKHDEEWATPKLTSVREIVGAFAHWAVKQQDILPPSLENVLGYLKACLASHFTEEFQKLSLCDISRLLHEILFGLEPFDAWNTTEAMGEEWLDLHALLHNTCVQIRDDRRHWEAFNLKFEQDWNQGQAGEGI